MRKFLIATHGNFAEGIKTSVEIIIGQTEHLFTISAYANGNKSIEDEINVVLGNISDDDELIIFTDLLGGSITNQVLRYALKPNMHTVSGFNLPLLIEVILGDEEIPVQEFLDRSIQNAKDQIIYVNNMLKSKKEDSLDD